MFVLGHSVVGPKLVRLIRPQLLLGWLVLGGILPDLIDKPLYYGLVFWTGKRGPDLGLISGTRTFGHTALFLLVFVLLALALRGRRAGLILAAIAWGIASHHFLDNLGDFPGMIWGPDAGSPSTLDGWIWPLHGWRFPFSPFKSVTEHLLSATRLYVLAGECLGLAILVDAWRKRRKRRR